MGAWSVSITGNDTAADLRYEYEAAFSRLPPEEAVERLDAYVRQKLDGDSWPDYVFSLALFLWKHGLLTAGVRSRALALIQSGAGLDLYGSPALRRKREKVLADFREKLCGPQPPPKPVRLRMHQKPVFHTGDMVALQISTAGKPFYPDPLLPETVFRQADSRWLLVRKLGNQASWQSRVVPEIRDLWPEFALLDFCRPHLPGIEEISGLPALGIVTGDGRMSAYRRWNAKVIGRSTGQVPPLRRRFVGVFFLRDDIGNCQKEVACLYRWGSCLGASHDS